MYAIACLAASFSLTGLENTSAVEVEITAGDTASPADTTVVSFLAATGLDVSNRPVKLVSEHGDEVIAQRDVTNPSFLHWLLEKPLAPRETRRYKITTDVVDQESLPQVKCLPRDGDYEFVIDDQPVLLYNAGLKPCPVEGFADCRRSGFIHPVYAPDGAVVSDDFPPEHPHQHGIMLAWVDSLFEGKTVDFWNSMKRQGIVEHVGEASCVSGPVYAELQVNLRHMQIVSETVQQPVLEELWRIRVYHSASPRMFDVQSKIVAVPGKTLHLKKYHYGGMAFRGAREWSFGKAEFLTSEGKDRESGNHTQPLWTAITGQIGEKDYTVAGVEFPSNFRYPQPVRLHPDMPYFCWSPVVSGEFDIAEVPYVSRYRFFVTEGSPDAEKLDELQSAMVEPIKGVLIE